MSIAAQEEERWKPAAEAKRKAKEETKRLEQERREREKREQAVKEEADRKASEKARRLRTSSLMDKQYDIFLSYARKDIDRARWFIKLFEERGLSIFWDLTSIPPGMTFHQFIRQSLNRSRCVVVLWSEASVSSKWVDIEAREGEKRGVLLPVLLDRLTEDQLPFGLHLIQATDLRDWDGKSSHHNLDLLLQTIDAKLGQEATAPSGPVAIAAPGDTFCDRLKDGSQAPEMVVIPAGEFQMGDIQGSGAFSEQPVHEVHIANPFAMGKYPVTFADYDRFAKATGRGLPSDEEWGRRKRPVINVSWKEAVAYTEWLSGETGKRYRLPTEAEWEYAARARTETEYWWGNEMKPNMANCDESGSQWSGKQTAPVGSFPANPFGLHDTAGNAWEWVQDCWHGNYEGAPEDGKAWEKKECYEGVLRGGSWYYGPESLRSSNRYWSYPDYRLNNIGFRLAQDL